MEMKSFLNQKSWKQNSGQQTPPSMNTNLPTQRYSAPLYLAQSPRIYVLPHPPPAYQGNLYQKQHLHSGSQTDQSIQEYSAESEQPNQASSTNQGQFNLNESAQSDPRFVPQNPTLQQPSQTAPPYQHYSDQSGVQQPYYSQWQPTAPPPPCYHQDIYGQPRNATDSPMVRETAFRRPPAESEPEGWTGFIDTEIRAKFIRKVYIILTLQLLFTLGIIALFIYEPNVKQFVQEHIYLYYVSLAIFFPVYIGLVCFQSVRRRFPLNIIALIIFTMAMSYMCATISTIYDTDTVLMAVGICAAVCFTVTVFSFYTKFDFTSCGGILCILLLILLLFGIIGIFFPTKVMRMIYAGLGATVFTLMLAYNTQMMMGGKNYELSPEEYVFAAAQIYIDIIYIFLFLLMLIGGDR